MNSIINPTRSFPADTYLFKVNSTNARTCCKTCSKYTINFNFYSYFILICLSVVLWKFLRSMLESLLNKVARLKFCNFIKTRLQHRCFPVNIAKCLRTSFFTEHLRWQLFSLINAKRYRNGVNWLRSSVFTVSFEHIPQYFYHIYCSLWAGNTRCFQNRYVSSQLKKHTLATTKIRKSVTLYEVKHQTNVGVYWCFIVKAWNLNFYLASISFASLSMYFVD